MLNNNTIGGVRMSNFKVYKKDVRAFIDKVERKAIKSVETKYEKLINESKKQRSEQYVKDVKVLIPNIESVLNQLNELYDEYGYQGKQAMYNDNWNSLSSAKNYMRDVLTYTNRVNHTNIDMSGVEKQMLTDRTKEIEEVKAEYSKLRHYIDNNSGMDSYNMLKEIGFDVTSLESRGNVIVAQADKSKLFVCGEKA